jgi:TolB-like protein
MKRLLLFISYVLFVVLQINAQERVYMPFFEVMNMHPDYQYSTSKLFKTYVENNNKYQIIIPARFDTLSLNESFDQIKQTASELNCSYFIQGELNRFGDIVIITISMYNTSDGQKIWHNISKAMTPDDIDPILEKMSGNLSNNNSTSEGDIYNVTNYESKELNKIGANKFFGVTIGGGYSFISNVSKNFPAGIGIVGSYDLRNVIFNLKAEAFFSDITIYYLNIDAIYPLSTAKSSAFLSAAMGYGGIGIKNDNSTTPYSDGGLFIFAGGGYVFNRNSNVSLRLSGSIYTPFFKVDGKMPAGILLTTTLLFGR